MENHVPAHPSQLPAFPDRSVYTEHSGGYPDRVLPKLSGSGTSAAVRQLGPCGGKGKEIPVFRTMAFHCAQRGNHDRGDGV